MEYHPQNTNHGIPPMEYHPQNTTYGIPPMEYHLWNTTYVIPPMEYHPQNTTYGIPPTEYHKWNTTHSTNLQKFHAVPQRTVLLYHVILKPHGLLANINQHINRKMHGLQHQTEMSLKTKSKELSSPASMTARGCI